MSKAEEFCNWLNTCPGLSNAKPVQIKFGYNNSFIGAICEHRRPFSATERAVEEKVAIAGEIHLTYRIYCLGIMPKMHAKRTVFTWKHEMPYDPKVEYSIGEWYRAGYIEKISPEHEVHHPFGPMFFLHEATPMAYGPYKDKKLDHYEPRQYIRTEMTVETLT